MRKAGPSARVRPDGLDDALLRDARFVADRRLLEVVHVELRRSLDPADLRAAPAGRIVSFAMTPLDISATRIRMLLSKGQSPRYLLPDPVIAHIWKHRFYSEN